MHDRPTVHELLEIVQTFLDEEIVPATTGRKQFLARVAANCIGMVDREVEAEDGHAERAWSGLDELLEPVTAPGDRGQRAAAATERLEELCARIRSGHCDEGTSDYERLLAFARERVRDKLEISNPKLLASDAKRGIG